MKLPMLMLIYSALFMAGCSAWVELTPAGQQVRVINASAAANCEKLGQTNASVADNVGGIKRRDDIVSANLESLARNSAAGMNGNAIVPASDIKDGKQTFDVYRCH